MRDYGFLGVAAFDETGSVVNGGSWWTAGLLAHNSGAGKAKLVGILLHLTSFCRFFSKTQFFARVDVVHTLKRRGRFVQFAAEDFSRLCAMARQPIAKSVSNYFESVFLFLLAFGRCLDWEIKVSHIRSIVFKCNFLCPGWWGVSGTPEDTQTFPFSPLAEGKCNWGPSYLGPRPVVCGGGLWLVWFCGSVLLWSIMTCTWSGCGALGRSSGWLLEFWG